jgi:Xaa-Pro aminopeptidase
MVVTIEPGIYIENFGGVRIEDTVLVKKNTCEVLNEARKDFLILSSY